MLYRRRGGWFRARRATLLTAAIAALVLCPLREWNAEPVWGGSANSRCSEGLLHDPSFELGPGHWGSDSISGRPIIWEDATRAYLGTHFAWLGGVAGAVESCELSKPFAIPIESEATLSFYLWIDASSGNAKDVLRVRVNGVTQLSIPATSALYQGDYQEVTIDVTPFANGENVSLMFEGTTTGFAPGGKVPAATDFLIDDVCVYVEQCVGGAAYSQAPMLPTSFGLRASSLATDITFDNIENPNGLLGRLEVWGIESPADGGWSDPCDAPVERMVVQFLSIGEFEPGSPLGSLSIPNFERTDTGLRLSGAPLYRYRFDLPSRSWSLPESVWMGVGSDDADCRFWWLMSRDGDDLSFSGTPLGEFEEQRSDFSVCVREFPVACHEPSLFGQAPAPRGDAYTFALSDAADGVLALERFTGVAEPIHRVIVWGVPVSTLAPGFCSLADSAFRVRFWEDNAGAPGTLAADQTIDPAQFSTYVKYGDRVLHHFVMALDPPVELGSGWVSVQNTGPSDCLFQWISSFDGDGAAFTRPGATGALTPLPNDLSLCLAGAPDTCGGASAFARRPSAAYETPEATASGPGIDDAAYLRFDGLDGPLTRVTWWGVADDGSDEGCGPTLGDFHIALREDGTNPGTLTFVERVTPTATDTGVRLLANEYYLTPRRVYRYEAAVGPTMVLPSGWIGISMEDASGCGFHWLDSPDGLRTAVRQFAPEVWSPITLSLSVCLEAGGEGEGEGAVSTHSADQNADHLIGLSELLRVIQFFNSANFGCESGTEDGYAPNDPDHGCTPHASDYNPQDWGVSLSELLRLIQFYNSGGYHPCPAGEDGFCPGP